MSNKISSCWRWELHGISPLKIQFLTLFFPAGNPQQPFPCGFGSKPWTSWGSAAFAHAQHSALGCLGFAKHFLKKALAQLTKPQISSWDSKPNPEHRQDRNKSHLLPPEINPMCSPKITTCSQSHPRPCPAHLVLPLPKICIKFHPKFCPNSALHCLAVVFLFVRVVLFHFVCVYFFLSVGFFYVHDVILVLCMI